MSEPHTVGEVNAHTEGSGAGLRLAYTGQGVDCPFNAETQTGLYNFWWDGHEDGFRSGVAYMRTHLLSLLAHVHPEGARYVETHGLDKACHNAETLVTNRKLMLRTLVADIREGLVAMRTVWPAEENCTHHRMQEAFTALKRHLPPPPNTPH